MRHALIISILMVFALAACGEKPDAPDSPDPTTYGKTIEPDHNVPEEDRKDHQREIRGGTVEMESYCQIWCLSVKSSGDLAV